MLLSSAQVETMLTSAIAINVPFTFWDEQTASEQPNDKFFGQIEGLHDPALDTVLILMCRSGKRTETAALHPDFPMKLFLAVYEMDRPDQSGHGGIQGSSYAEAFVGYRGFAGRNTLFQNFPSVAWKDAGLPIKIGVHT